jgi:hypothetical protein
MKKSFTKYRAYGLALVVALFTAPAVMAQTVKTSYFMSNAPARQHMNPAFHPETGFFGLPVLSNVYFGTNTNTLVLENFIFPYQEPGGEKKTLTFMHEKVDAAKFLSNISRHNYITTDVTTDILSIGFNTKRAYWNIYLGTHARTDIDLPGDLFRLLKIGFQDQGASSTPYDLSGLRVGLNSYAEFSLGYSRGFLGGRLQAGIRPKLLIGLADASLKVETLDVEAGADFWQLRSRALMEVSGPVTAKHDGNMGNFKGFNTKWNGIPGLGGGIDLGASFRVFDLGRIGILTVSAAVNDIGFFTWSAKNNYYARTTETSVRITPADYSVHQTGESSSIEDVFDDAIDDLESGLDFFPDPARAGEKRRTNLHTRFNAGVEYAVWNNRASLGILYSHEGGDTHSTGQLLLSANFRPCSWFAASASYSVLERGSDSMGLAIHLAPRVGPTLFVASDCALARTTPQWVPVRGYNMNVQVGIAFNTGGGRKK